MSDKREDRATAARTLFASLNLTDWMKIPLTRPQGGHAGTLVVERTDGARGVFRCLPQDSQPLLVERFHRELRILENLQHPNIMELLDCTTSEACWYISRLGKPFDEYWKQRREDLVDEPEKAVTETIKLLQDISAGLAACHSHRIVHRDIKPANLIVMDEDDEIRPVLIDFGVAHVDDEPRITPLDEAVGNARYSPSRMQWSQDTVSPWFDIFELSQVMLWMLQADRPAKHYWPRPVDWRFVRFDDRLPTETILKLEAIAAQCSEEELAPKDGQGLFDLLTRYFPVKKTDLETTSAINGEGILSGLAQAAATDALHKAEDHRVIESAYRAAVVFAESVREAVWELVEQLEADLPQCTFRHRQHGDFASGDEKLLTTPNHPGGSVFEFWIEAADRPHCGFAVRMTVRVYRPSAKGTTSLHEPPEGAYPFVFMLGASSLRGSVKLNIRVMLTLQRDGRVVLQEATNSDRPVVRNGIPAEGIAVTVEDITDRIAAWCIDPHAWEVVGREYP